MQKAEITSPEAPDAAGPPAVMTTRLAVLLSTAGGLIAANLYYAQPLAGLIGPALGLSPGAAGLIVTLTQLGYGLGLLLVVPLGDLVENRRLILLLGIANIAALLGAALAGSPALFLGASLCIGLSSVSVQILVPYASHLAPEAIARAGGRQHHERPDARHHAGPPRRQPDRPSGVLACRVRAVRVGPAAGEPCPGPFAAEGGGRRQASAMGTCCCPWPGLPGPPRSCSGGRCTMRGCSAPSACSGPRFRCCSPGRPTISRRWASRGSPSPASRAPSRRPSRAGWRTGAGAGPRRCLRCCWSRPRSSSPMSAGPGQRWPWASWSPPVCCSISA